MNTIVHSNIYLFVTLVQHNYHLEFPRNGVIPAKNKKFKMAFVAVIPSLIVKLYVPLRKGYTARSVHPTGVQQEVDISISVWTSVNRQFKQSFE